MELKKFAEQLIGRAKDLVDDIELCIGAGKSLNYEIRNRNISPDISLGIYSVGIRILKDGKIGSSAISQLDVDEGMLAVRKAMADTKETALKSFSKMENIPKIDNYDAQIMGLFDRPDELKKSALQMRDRIYEGAVDLQSFEGSVGIAYGERLIATSSGMAFSRSTNFEAVAWINSIDYDFILGNTKPDFEKVKALGIDLYKSMPKGSVKPKQMDVMGKEIDVIIDPMCLESVLRTLLSEKIYASSKASGMSHLSIGGKIADDSFTLVDTGISRQLLSSSPTDDEGSASKETLLIEQGVLKNFLYDRVSAVKAGKSSTGNGMRRPLLAESSTEAPVRETMRGISITPGEKKLSDIVSGIAKGVYVKGVLGMHTADKARASFAVTISNGKSIEKGKFTNMLEPGVWKLSASLFDTEGRKGMLKEVELSSDTRNTGSAILPWMRVKLKF